MPEDLALQASDYIFEKRQVPSRELALFVFVPFAVGAYIAAANWFTESTGNARANFCRFA